MNLTDDQKAEVEGWIVDAATRETQARTDLEKARVGGNAAEIREASKSLCIWTEKHYRLQRHLAGEMTLDEVNAPVVMYSAKRQQP